MNVPTPSRLRPRDTVGVAFSGLRSRPLRTVLSALGIAVGIAAMVAVVGISASSQEQVNQQLRALGTDLLTVSAGTSFPRRGPSFRKQVSTWSIGSRR